MIQSHSADFWRARGLPTWLALCVLGAAAIAACSSGGNGDASPAGRGGGHDDDAGSAPSAYPPDASGDGSASRDPMVTVPTLVGLGIEAAGKAIDDADLRFPDRIDKVEFETVAQVSDPPVVILGQTPAAGTRVLRGTTIRLKATLPPDQDGFPLPSRRQFLVDTLLQDTAASADAYYAIVDPSSKRLTLTAWKSTNGFGTPADAEASAIYVNHTDLGFGRHMYMRRLGKRAAFYVDNYANVDDTIDNKNLIATVAMEYSPPDSDANGPSFTKFFVFKADGSRITAPALDTRGSKFQPGVCLACHGGRPNPEGNYQGGGDVGAHFIPFDLDTLAYSTRPGFTRADQLGEFKKLNEAVQGTYATTFAFPGPAVSIPDADPNGVDIPISVTGQGAVRGLSVSLGDANEIGIEHSFLPDLEVTLIAPSGKQVKLVDRMRIPNPPTRELAAIPGDPITSIIGLASDALGSAVFVESKRCAPAPCLPHLSLKRIEANGSLTVLAAWDADVPASLASGPDGSVYVVGPAAVARLDPKLKLTPAYAPPSGYLAAPDLLGSLFFLGSQGVSVTHQGGPSLLISDQNGVGLALDPRGNIIVNTGQSLRVLDGVTGALSATIPFVPTFSAASSTWRELASDVHGNFYSLSDNFTDKPQVVRVEAATGNLVLVLGAPMLADTEVLGSVATTPAGDVLVRTSLSNYPQPTITRFFRLGPIGGSSFVGTLFDDSAVASIQDAPGTSAPFTGSWKPAEPLLASLLGEPANGIWKLHVVDRVTGAVGKVHHASLHFSDSAGLAASHAITLVDGWYGGAGHPTGFDGQYTPPGWSPPEAPLSAKALYHNVVAPACRLCHSQLNPSIDFSTYAQFMGFAERTKARVFDEGTMPLTEKGYWNFWLSYPSQPAMLWNAVAGTTAGPWPAPGRPIARVAPDIASKPGATESLDATRSVFAKTYAWTQVAGPTVAIANADTARASVTTPSSGTTTLRFQVVVSDGVATSAPAIVTITSVNVPISYQTAIQPIWLANCAGQACHSPGTSGTLSLTAPSHDNVVAPSTNPSTFSRVSTADPPSSIILKKATATISHGGGFRFAAGSAEYNQVIRWISEGALDN